jgi:hypothetical protein
MGIPLETSGNVAQSERDKLADALAALSRGHEVTPPQPARLEPVAPADAGADDDDEVAAPAPDASVFAPRRRTADLLLERRVHNQRTAIPVLLTCGVILPLIGSFKWLASRDSIFAQWDIWMPVILSIAGVLLLAVAVINMLHVRDALRRRESPHV